jgi:SulP family sulfate permease
MQAHGSRNLLASVVAGSVAGLMTTVAAVSSAALVFSGELAPHLPLGVQIALITAAVVGAVIAMGSSFRFIISGPDSNSTAVLALLATTITPALASVAPDRVIPTLRAAMAVGTLATGVCLYLLGRLRAGRLIRFIPYPVVGGFLAGTGWLLLRGAVPVLTGRPLSLDAQLLAPAMVARWAPGLAFALVLLFGLRRFKHYLVLPCLLAGAMGLAHLVRAALGYTLAEAVGAGFFVAPPPAQQAALPSSLLSLAGHVDWSLVAAQAPDMGALVAVSAISILLGAAGIELASGVDADLDRELRATGLSNLLSAVTGGMVGFLSVSRTVLVQRAGANSRLAGLSAAAVAGLFLLWGGPLLSLLPKAMLGGLLLYLGLGLLREWVLEAGRRLARADQALVLVILLVVAWRGFISGVAVGLVIACLLFAVDYGRWRVIRLDATGATLRSNMLRAPDAERVLEREGARLRVLCLQGYVFFGSANHLLEHVRAQLAGGGRRSYLLLDFRLVAGLDSSATWSFARLQELAERESVSIAYAGLRDAVRAQLTRAGLALDDGDAARTFPDLDRALEWCESQLLASEGALEDVVPLSRSLTQAFLAPWQLDQFVSWLEPVELATGATLCRRGDAPDALYFIESGRISAMREVPGAPARRLRTITCGNLVGEIAAFTGTPRAATLVADEPSRLYRLSVKRLREMQFEHPALAAALTQHVIALLAERLSHSAQEVDLLLRSE